MNNVGHYDAIVVGAGAIGAVYCHELTKAGMRVLVIEKGQYFENHMDDFVENELNMFPLVWDHNNYDISGNAFDGGPNLGANVGGGTLAWTAAALRFFKDDFRFKTKWGAVEGAAVEDWPISKRQLQRYYEIAERQMGVSGTEIPWDENGDTPPPLPPLPYYRGSKVLETAFESIGLRHGHGRVATNSEPYDGRPACVNCGYCRSGCRSDAKYQSDRALIKPALETGNLTLVTESIVTKVHTKRKGKKASGIDYVNTMTKEKFHATADYVILCNNPIEIPRLLLSSTDKYHPNGIGNQYDQIGRHFFSHATSIAMGLTNQDLRSAVGHSMSNIMSLDLCQNEEFNDFVGGFSLLSLHGAGAGPLAAYSLKHFNGCDLHQHMSRYNSSLVMISFIEAMPVPTNRININRDVLDEYGMPVGTVHYEWHPNDLAAYERAKQKMTQVLNAAGSDTVFVSDNFESHPMGSMRMGNDPHTSATDRFGRVHGVKNLYVGGGCLFVTGSSVNPTLTMHALALRSAHKILRRAGLSYDVFSRHAA